MEAVIIYEGISLRIVSQQPVLREFLTSHLAGSGFDASSADYSMALAQGLKQLRPEIDIYFLSDRQVEKVAGDVNGGLPP